MTSQLKKDLEVNILETGVGCYFNTKYLSITNEHWAM